MSGHIGVKESQEMDIDKAIVQVESEEVYKRIFELSPDPIFVHCAGQVVLANPAAEKLFNVKNYKEMIGKNVMDFIHPDYIDIASSRINTIYEGGMIEPLIEEKFLSIDGTVKDVEIGTSAFKYQDKSAILVIARNIDKRKNMERDLRAAENIIKENQERARFISQAMEYDKFRTDFFANISHELRTPINVILGTLQLMDLKFMELFNKDDKKSRVYLKSMKQNCYRLVRLINNLIDVTKIDAGYLEIHLSNCNIVSVIEEITLSVAEYVENNGLSLLFDTQMEEKIIACDKEKIERIMLNLISNAIKFTNSGGNIKVNIFERKENIVVSVLDTGIGISKGKQECIFERFIQVDKPLSRSREGSGIGLSLVKALVEMHGGKIFLESQLDVGSEFTFEIPVIQLPHNEAVYVNNNLNANNNTEKINIEFSDIYR